MLRIAIVEDEEMAARRLLRLLGENLIDRPHQLHRLYSLGEALEYVRSAPIDLLFLDLNLYGEDGFDVLRSAVASSFHTIVCSANTQRALEAFELGVLDFVPKPFSKQRLALALDRALGAGGKPTSQPSTRVLAIRKTGRIELVPITEISYLCGAGNYVEVVTEDGARHLHDKTLDRLERLLPERFLRVHRSYIVDSDRVRQLLTHGGGRYELTLDDDQESVPVSRTYVRDVRQRLEEQERD